MNQAYATLICNGDSYLAGVETLGRSLEDTGSGIPRVVMVTSDVTSDARKILAAQGWLIREVTEVPCPDNGNDLIFERYRRSFTKLRAFDLAEYDKVVFLDADTVVVSNVDDLFQRPAFAAAPDFFMPDRFNSGVMVLEPSRELFQAIVGSIGNLDNYDGGDQGLLNAHFSGWWTSSAEHRLGPAYNMHHFVYQFMTSHEGLRKSFIDEIKIIHYTLQKPWKQFTVSGAAALWWKKYYEVHPEAQSAWSDRVHAMQDSTFDRAVSLLGGST